MIAQVGVLSIGKRNNMITTYSCGHVWRTGLNGTPQEQERLKKLVEGWAKGPCYCCQQEGIQKLDSQIDPDGLDASGRALWDATEQELQALERLDQYLEGDSEAEEL